MHIPERWGRGSVRRRRWPVKRASPMDPGRRLDPDRGPRARARIERREFLAVAGRAFAGGAAGRVFAGGAGAGTLAKGAATTGTMATATALSGCSPQPGAPHVVHSLDLGARQPRLRRGRVAAAFRQAEGKPDCDAVLVGGGDIELVSGGRPRRGPRVPPLVLDAEPQRRRVGAGRITPSGSPSAATSSPHLNAAALCRLLQVGLSVAGTRARIPARPGGRTRRQPGGRRRPPRLRPSLRRDPPARPMGDLRPCPGHGVPRVRLLLLRRVS